MAVNITYDNCSLDLTEAEIPIILVLTLIFNLISLVIIIRMKCLTESIDHLLVTTLTINDLFSTVVYTTMWLGGWMTCGVMLQNISCDIMGWLGTVTVMYSAGIIVIMSSCRYLALVRPIFYRMQVTLKSVKIALVTLLLYFVLVTIFPLCGITTPYYYYNSNFVCAYNFTPGDGAMFHRGILGLIAVSGIVTTLIVLFFNISIIRQLRKTSSVGHADSANKGSVLQSKRLTITTITLVVSLVYCFTYGPFLIRVLLDVIINSDAQEDLYHSITMSLLFLSPLLNPIIYVFLNARHRHCLLQLLKSVIYRLRCRKMPIEDRNSDTLPTANPTGHI
ncbi:hypothetical protein LOTGIDRAFT_170320 [Lottia gigantea]|uniref:G-protein coupled receptors family 1 profile domain-containing protein n=1 Tax=Lottia gigantea TaxID=225164 RepID=V3ZIA7_LOTGI|nr:hypothetical protein LOTGIDRAFT_170320 [Lottia gigantea]ESO82045.1 hypothetical protein LOTGIDRAFT_170320 [Lottia gigantea]